MSTDRTSRCAWRERFVDVHMIRARHARQDAMDLYNAYRKTFATLDPDELVVWWYCGVLSSEREGVGMVPMTQAETIMVYRTRDIDRDTFTIEWTEVGMFRDIVTGEVMDGWTNPFDGLVVPYPKSFVDGPATFTLRRRGADDIDIELEQHNARIDGVRLETRIHPDTVELRQTETKARTFHRPDGSLPPLDGPDAAHIDTVLTVWSARAALDDRGLANAPSRGFYTSGSRPGNGGSWGTTRVEGVMRKARVDEKINPTAWDRLQRVYPAFFTGDRIDPEWT